MAGKGNNRALYLVGILEGKKTLLSGLRELDCAGPQPLLLSLLFVLLLLSLFLLFSGLRELDCAGPQPARDG